MENQQKQIPFTVSSSDLKKMIYNDCVYAWLLVHSYNDENEYHNYIYKNTFTFKQIAKEIHRTAQTVSKRFKELLDKGFLIEKKVKGETAYIIPYSNPFEYLDSETVVKLLSLPLKEQKEELIKTLAYILSKYSVKKKEGVKNFNLTSKEIIDEFGHSAGHL